MFIWYNNWKARKEIAEKIKDLVHGSKLPSKISTMKEAAQAKEGFVFTQTGPIPGAKPSIFLTFEGLGYVEIKIWIYGQFWVEQVGFTNKDPAKCQEMHDALSEILV